MPTGENAKLQYESGQTPYAMEALTDSGDQTIFTSNASLFSGASGKEPNVKPDGLATGGIVIPAVSASNDVVDISAITGYSGGVLKTLSASIDESITRATGDVASITSIWVTSAGVIGLLKGTDSADTSFSETRGVAGGPPYIPDGAFEIAQVRTITNVVGAITADEIFQTIGLHQERYDSPLWTIASQDAEVIMGSALPLIHGTGTTAKGVNASYADPLFADIELASDYIPSEISHSISSKQIYNKTLGSSSQSLSQGTFTAYLQDGVTDALVKARNNTLFFKFFPDRYKALYILDQGKLGMTREFPAGDQLSCACTISASEASVGVES